LEEEIEHCYDEQLNKFSSAAPHLNEFLIVMGFSAPSELPDTVVKDDVFRNAVEILKTYVESAESKLLHAERYASEYKSKLEIAARRASGWDSDRRIEEAERQASEYKSKLEIAERRGSDSDRRIEEAERRASESKSKLETAERYAWDSNRRRQEAEKRYEELKSKAGEEIKEQTEQKAKLASIVAQLQNLTGSS
jgi:chromosome segregation ATPase